jgi:hypothetical protein
MLSSQAIIALPADRNPQQYNMVSRFDEAYARTHLLDYSRSFVPKDTRE